MGSMKYACIGISVKAASQSERKISENDNQKAIKQWRNKHQ